MLPNEGPRLRMGGMDAYEKPKTPTQLISYSNHKLFNVQKTHLTAPCTATTTSSSSSETSFLVL